MLYVYFVCGVGVGWQFGQLCFDFDCVFDDCVSVDEFVEVVDVYSVIDVVDCCLSYCSGQLVWIELCFCEFEFEDGEGYVDGCFVEVDFEFVVGVDVGVGGEEEQGVGGDGVIGCGGDNGLWVGEDMMEEVCILIDESFVFVWFFLQFFEVEVCGEDVFVFDEDEC